MTIFRLPRFLRRFLRRHMTPMTEESAWSTKDKLAIAYAFIAWNAAGLALYQIFGKGNVHWPVSRGIKDPEEEMIRPAIQYAHLLGHQKASVYTVSGLNVSDRVDFEVDKKAPLTKSYKILSRGGTQEEELVNPTHSQLKNE